MGEDDGREKGDRGVKSGSRGDIRGGSKLFLLTLSNNAFIFFNSISVHCHLGVRNPMCTIKWCILSTGARKRNTNESIGAFGGIPNSNDHKNFGKFWALPSNHVLVTTQYCETVHTHNVFL